MRQKIDTRISSPERCNNCDDLLMASPPDPDGFVVCPSCFHSHPVTPRAFLAVARDIAGKAKDPHPGATAGL